MLFSQENLVFELQSGKTQPPSEFNHTYYLNQASRSWLIRGSTRWEAHTKTTDANRRPTQKGKGFPHSSTDARMRCQL